MCTIDPFPNTRPATASWVLWAAVGLATACGEEDVLRPPVWTDFRPATDAECPEGGTVILSGVDLDRSGSLEAAEVTRTEAVCNARQGDRGERGETGPNALIRTVDEAPGSNCPDGGLRIESGLDDDADGNLAAGEVDQSVFICDQPAGQDGLGFLVDTSTDGLDACEQGGLRVESGFDLNRDGALQPEEVQFTEVACAGADGLDRRILTDGEPPGLNCALGGQSVVQGFDRNRDGTLQPTEIDEVEFLCVPIPSLVATATVGPGADCAEGGLRLERGLDQDGSGILEPVEVVDTTLLCRGADGRSALVRTSSEAAGMNCAVGGTRIESGFDEDANGVLDPTEVTSERFACNGEDGADGRGGSAVRVTAEPAGANCAAGGTRIETGPDVDGDGQLADPEVSNTTFACDAPDATQNLVALSEEPAGANCLSGGQRVDSGFDDNADGILQAGEIDETSFVCSNTPVVPVRIISDPSATGFTSSEVVVEVMGVGGLGGGYQWSLQNAPPNVQIEPSGTPSVELTSTATIPGVYVFDIFLVDSVGASARQTFTLTLNAPPCAPGQDGAIAGMVTNITVPSNFSGSVRGMAADDSATGWVYFVEPNLGFNRFRKDGSQKEDDIQTQITGLANGDIGYEMDIDGNNIYVTSDDTACTTTCVYRLSNDGGATFSFQDLADFTAPGSPNDDLRGIHVDGNTMYVITHNPVETELWSINLGGTLPDTAPVRLATFPDLETCSGLEGDDSFLYTACNDVNGGSSVGVARIDLATLVAEVVVETPSFFTVGSDIISALYGQDLNADGDFDILFVTGDSGDDLYVCEPAASTVGNNLSAEWLDDFSGDDEGMAFDRVNGAFYKVDEFSDAAAEIE